MKLSKIVLIVALCATSLLSKDLNVTDEFFLGLNVGYVYTKTSVDGDVEPIIKLEYDGVLYGVEAGYRATENIFYTINYSKSYIDERSFDNYFLSANYLFNPEEDISFYVGGLAGWSSVSWKEDPVVSAPTSGSKSSNYLIGAQAGVEYALNQELMLYFTFNYSYSPQEATLYDTTTLKYDNRHNALIGFRYYILENEEGN